MPKYEQASRFRNVHYDIRGRNMLEARRMEAEGHRIMHLNIGNLADFGFAPPETMVRSVITHLPESHGYADAHGINSAKVAVANYYQTRGMQTDVSQALKAME